MPGNDGVESDVTDGIKTATGHQPPKVPLLGISKLNRGGDCSSSSNSEDSGSRGRKSGKKNSKNEHHHRRRNKEDEKGEEEEEETTTSSHEPFNEGTFQTITPRTLSLLTPRSAAAYNAAAFSSFKGGSSSSFSPCYGTAAMQHCFKSYGKLMHYAAKARDVDDLIKRTELSVDRLRFSSVSFSNAWKLGRMASAVYITKPDQPTESDSTTSEATFRDTVLVWKFHGTEEHPESVSCKPMDIHQCADESFCADCSYLFAVFVATFYSPKESFQKISRQQRSTSADAINLAHPSMGRAESEGEDDKSFSKELLFDSSGSASPSGRPHIPHLNLHHRGYSDESNSPSQCNGGGIKLITPVEENETDEEKPVKHMHSGGSSPPNHSALAQSTVSSSSFSEPTIIKLDWEDNAEDQDDADADKEIADTLSSPPLHPYVQKLQAVRPVVPPPEELSERLGCGQEETTLCAERFFDTTMTPRGISSAFATLPRVKDDDVMHVNSAMLHHLGGTSAALLGDHKEIGIGQVCINIHIWNGDKSSSFTRAAAFSKAIRLDRAWALPSAARAASLLVFSDACVDTGAITTPRGEHIISKPIGDSQSTLGGGTGPKEYSLSALIRSKLLRTYRTLAASFSSSFLQMLAGAEHEKSQPEESSPHASEGKFLKVRLDSGSLSPTPSTDYRSPDEDGHHRPHRKRYHRRRSDDRDSSDSSEWRPNNRCESDSDNDDFVRPSEFKVPYNVIRVPNSVRDRTSSMSADFRNPSCTDSMVHVDHRQTVSDDEYSDGSGCALVSKREGMKVKPASEGMSSPNSSSISCHAGSSAFRPVSGRINLVVSRDGRSTDKPLSPVTKDGTSKGNVSPVTVTKVSTSPVVRTSISPVAKGSTSPMSRGSPSPKGRSSPSPTTTTQYCTSSPGLSPSSAQGKPTVKSQPLKASGKSVSTTALTSKKPAVPMLALGAVSDPRRCNSQAQLMVKKTLSPTTTPSSDSRGSKSSMSFSVPKLPLSSCIRTDDSGSEHHRSHSSDPSQEQRGRTRSSGCSCDDDDDDFLLSAAERENDRNGGECSGMRRYRSVLSKINDQLYLTGESGAQDLAAMQELGVEQVLNVADAVCHEYHPGQFKYLSIDLQDNGAKEDLRPLFLQTIDFIEKGRTVLHCQQGVSRSATFVIAYVMWKNQLTFRQALDYVMERRPVVGPNGGFMGQLLLWEVVLHNSRDALKSAPPRLLRVMAHPGSRHEVLMVAKDVANVSRASLDSRTCFVLHNPATRTVYMWIGTNCPPSLLAGAASVCQMMKKYLWVENLVEERQDFESDAFWRTLRDNRGSVGIVEEFNRDYAFRPPGFIYRYSAFDPVELRHCNVNSLREQTKRQAWVYFPDKDSDLIVSVPKDFIMRLNGREITNPNEIATIVCRLFCLAANIPESTPFKYIEDGREILDAWLGTNPTPVVSSSSTTATTTTLKMVPPPRKDID